MPKDHSTHLVLCLLAYAAERDLSPDSLCASAGIDLSARVSPDQMGQLWTEAIRVSNDPLFGLHFGESLQLYALGIVGEVVKSSATVGMALELASSLVSTITTTFSLAITKDAKTFTVAFHPSDPGWRDLVAFRQTLDLLMVFLVHELDGLLLKKIRPSRVVYGCPLDDLREYERVLRCRPSVSPDSTTATFELGYWNEPIITANHELQQVLLRDFLQAPSTLPNLSTQIRDYMTRNSYLGVVSLDEMAANFNLSVRTLQRRLKEEGTTFEDLADNVRKTIAIGYLRSGAYPVKEVSMMLGYNDLANFSRSFKRWTGVRPSEYAGNQ